MNALNNVIVIDGVSASGKSTIASYLAAEFNYFLFDSGSLYRSFCYFLKVNNVELTPRAVYLALQEFHPELLQNGNILLDGQDITSQLHSREIDEIVPLIGSAFFVRNKIRSIQRTFCENHDGRIIITGRDVGKEVVPESKYKFFIMASAEVRAFRRARQGIEPVDEQILETTKNALIARDDKDSSRKVSPMIMPEDAILIDTSDLSIEQVLDKIKQEIEQKRVSIEGPAYKGLERR